MSRQKGILIREVSSSKEEIEMNLESFSSPTP